MEIRGSSVNYSIIRLNSQHVGKVDVASKHGRHNSPSSETRKSQDSTAQTPSEVEKILAGRGLTPIKADPENFYQPRDYRILHAINAYTSQSNQDYVEQREQVIVGVDLFA